MASLGVIGTGTLLWQNDLTYAEEAQSAPAQEEQKVEVVESVKAEVQEEEEEELVGGVFKMLTAENVEKIMKDEKTSRFVYFYRGDENEIGPVAAFAQKMAKGMGTEAIIIDCD